MDRVFLCKIKYYVLLLLLLLYANNLKIITVISDENVNCYERNVIYVGMFDLYKTILVCNIPKF